MPQDELLGKLHDIKPIIEIPDNSFFIFILLIFIAFLLFLTLIFFMIKLIKNRKKNQRKIYFETLKNIDFNNSKNAAYTITKYSRLLARNERELRLCDELVDELSKYKYKKEVPKISDKIKAKFENFMDVIDV